MRKKHLSGVCALLLRNSCMTRFDQIMLPSSSCSRATNCAGLLIVKCPSIFCCVPIYPHMTLIIMGFTAVSEVALVQYSQHIKRIDGGKAFCRYYRRTCDICIFPIFSLQFLYSVSLTRLLDTLGFSQTLERISSTGSQLVGGVAF